MDPVADPWDDKIYHCKEGHKKEGGLPALFSSLRETTHIISVPAPPSTGLLVLGFVLIQAATLRRRKRVNAEGAQS
jgi:hypothetical protein